MKTAWGLASMPSSFVLLPQTVFLDRRLSLTDLRVLGALFSFRSSSTDWDVWPARATLGRRCNITSVSRISKTITRLQSFGWLTITYRRGSSVYHLNDGTTQVLAGAAQDLPTTPLPTIPTNCSAVACASPSAPLDLHPAVHMEETPKEETIEETPLPPEGEAESNEPSEPKDPIGHCSFANARSSCARSEYRTEPPAFPENTGPTALFPVDQVIHHLNQKTGSLFDPRDFRRFLRVRTLRWGFSIEELTSVVDLKFKEWSGTVLEKHLTPTILFKTKAKLSEYVQETSAALRANRRPNRNTGGTRAGCHRLFSQEELAEARKETSVKNKEAAKKHLEGLRSALHSHCSQAAQ